MTTVLSMPQSRSTQDPSPLDVPGFLRALADAIESGDYHRQQERPSEFVSTEHDEIAIAKPGEARWAWHERTGSTTIEFDRNQILSISRPLKTVGYVPETIPVDEWNKQFGRTAMNGSA